MIDYMTINVRAGNGGHGAMSFRREKYVARGGPDGGDGGKGGDVVARAVEGMVTLQAYRGRLRLSAESGANGRGKKKTGHGGQDRVLDVPVGTVVRWQGLGSGGVVDLSERGSAVVVARGGEGGRGNVHFASATNRAPRLAERGELGEEVEVILELKLLADVGVVGLPNAGKSSLLAAATGAHPRVGAYPFTTTEPNLGVAEMGWAAFVVADIPGLIEGAHAGRGLGDQFLRHIERTAVLIHLVDGGHEDPVGAWRTVSRELELHGAALARKPQVVAVNKLDLPQVRARREEEVQAFREAGVGVSFISAVTGEGVPELLREAYRYVASAREARSAGREAPPASAVLRPQPRRVPVRVEAVAPGVWRLVHPRAERLVGLADLGDVTVVAQLWRELARFGAGHALEAAGAQPGDLVRLGPGELVWR